MGGDIQEQIAEVDSSLKLVRELSWEGSPKKVYLVEKERELYTLKYAMASAAYQNEKTALERLSDLEGITHLVKPYEKGF